MVLKKIICPVNPSLYGFTGQLCQSGFVRMSSHNQKHNAANGKNIGGIALVILIVLQVRILQYSISHQADFFVQ